jgi:hypothetical protein
MRNYSGVVSGAGLDVASSRRAAVIAVTGRNMCWGSLDVFGKP